MAEFCLRCFNEMNGTRYQTREVWLENDFCEGCGEWKPCVIDLRRKPLLLRVLDAVCGIGEKHIDTNFDER